MHQGRVAAGRQRLFIGLDRLFETLAEPRLQLLLRDVPDPRQAVGRGPVDLQRPAIDVPDNRRQPVERHGTVDAERRILVGAHAVGKLVDEVAIWLEHQGDQLLLALDRQVLLGPFIEPVPRRCAVEGARGDMRLETGEIRLEHGQFLDLERVFRTPLGGIDAGAGQERAERRRPLRLRRGLGADAGERLFARRNPVVEQHRMVDDERRQAEPGGIADADTAAQIRIERYRGFGRARPRQVLDQIENIGTGQEHGQHLGLEGCCKFRPVGDRFAVGGAELARPVDGSGAHQVADRLDLLGIGLTAGRETVDHMGEQADRPVGPRHADLFAADPPGLLLRYVPGEALDIVRARHAVEQREGRIPGMGDDPVRPLLGRQVVGETDQAVGALRAARGVDRDADAVLVDVEHRTLEAPGLALQPAQQGAHE